MLMNIRRICLIIPVITTLFSEGFRLRSLTVNYSMCVLSVNTDFKNAQCTFMWENSEVMPLESVLQM